jgi:hypothetical protein
LSGFNENRWSVKFESKGTFGCTGPENPDTNVKTREEHTMARSWEDVKYELADIRREREFDHQAHTARTHILHVDLGFKATKLVLRALQAIHLYPKP